MKFLHIADLHLGKRYNELSLIPDQRYILEQILSIVRAEKPRAVLVAGDIYDKSVPSVEAVELFDFFINSLSDIGVAVFVISGNHDGAERLAFGSRLLGASNVYISPVYDGTVKPVKLYDEYGEVDVYSLPFIKPATVRRFFGDDISTYTQAVKAAVAAMNVDTKKRNVLVAHQFVTGSTGSGSEEVVVGDLGNVDGEAFAPFDYVALGHIHGAQNVYGERVRYAGAPLKYSLAEKDSEKSVTIAELKTGREISVRTVPLKPLKDVAEIRGTYAEITKKSFYDGAAFKNDLLHIVLTDEDEVPDALGKLRIIYPYVMSLKYDNARTRATFGEITVGANADKSPEELFEELYEKQNNAPLSEEQRGVLSEIIQKIWGGGE